MRRKVFYRSNIDKKKQEIKSYLDQNSDSPTARLDLIVQRLNILKSEEETSENRLSTFIYIMSALVHHQKFGGLTKPSINRFTEYAEAILISENIDAGLSRLSFLYVELYAVLSQINMNHGEHWPSAWKLMSAFHFQYKPSDKELAWKSLGLAIRFLRLGHCEKALEYYRKCDFQFGESHLSYQSKIGQMICLRFLGQYEEITQLQNLLYSQDDTLPKEVDLDLKWEQTTSQIYQDGNPSPLFKLVNKRKDGHSNPSYQLEAYFWSKIKRPLSQSPVSKPSTISRSQKMNRNAFKKLYQASTLLEKSLDTNYTLAQRLKYLGEMTEFSSEVRTLDRELLILAVTVVWLKSHGFKDMQEIAWQNYKSKCLQISSGRVGDLLQVEGQEKQSKSLYKIVS